MTPDRIFIGTDADEFIFCAPNVEGYRDFLFGGEGADTFVLTDVAYSATKTPDYIGDFGRGEDVIDLSVIDSNPYKTGNQEFRFIKGRPFHDAPGELRFGRGTLKGDIDGDGRPDFKIKVVGVHVLSHDDLGL